MAQSLINRGLDDQQLAEVTGMAAGAVRSRREAINTAFSCELHLLQVDVRTAPAQIEPTVVEGGSRLVKN